MRKRFITLALAGGILVGGGRGAEPKSLGETRDVLAKWVETRQLVSRAKTDWQADKELLEQTVKLFERELAQVEQQFSKAGTNGTQVEKERAQTEALQKSAAESLEQTRQFAAKFEARFMQVLPRLPAPLQEILKPLLGRLPADPANTKMTPAERVQVVVGLLNEVDKFNNAVSLFTEKRKNAKGEEVAVETVYVGLGAAYFVNETGDFAGTGTTGANGWEWTPKNELAPAVREVIRIYRNERPARFVALPATIR